MKTLSSIIILLEWYHHVYIVLGSLESSQLHHLGIAYQVGVLHSPWLSTHHAVVTHRALSTISHLLMLLWAFVSLRSILHVLFF